MSTGIWQPLRDELALWCLLEIAPNFWLRDDDVIEPSSDLDRLIDLTDRHLVPLTLAVIPAMTGDALARRLAGAPHVLPAVHGWSHANHAPEGEKRAELGLHRELAEVLGDCSHGLEKLRGLYRERLLAMMVPPWNRIDAVVAAGLPQVGFRALSAFGRRPGSIVSGLTICDTHVDLVDSRGTRKCRETPFLVQWLAAELRQARELGARDCGVLSHHLVDAEGQLGFLRELFAETTGLWQAPAITPQ
jgi:hypothetical protein